MRVLDLSLETLSGVFCLTAAGALGGAIGLTSAGSGTGCSDFRGVGGGAGHGNAVGRSGNLDLDLSADDVVELDEVDVGVCTGRTGCFGASLGRR